MKFFCMTEFFFDGQNFMGSNSFISQNFDIEGMIYVDEKKK